MEQLIHDIQCQLQIIVFRIIGVVLYSYKSKLAKTLNLISRDQLLYIKNLMA